MKQLAASAIRLDNDVNGNPRYYLSVVCFVRNDQMYRPRHCVKYRGKRYGAGWVFQSYNLESDLKEAVK
jgi:hypothetical protein